MSRLDELRAKAARLEELKAKAAQTAAPQEPVVQPSFTERVGERFAQRSSDLADVMSQVGAPETRFDPVRRVGLPSLVLQTAGQTAGGMLDVFSEGVRSLAGTVEEAFPEQTRALRGGMAALRSVQVPFQSPATRRAQEFVSEDVPRAAAEFEQKFPKQAGEIGAAANILMAASPRRATRGTRAKKAFKKRREFTDDLILKNTTPNQRKALAARSRQEGKKVVVKLTPHERRVSREVAKLKGVSPKNTLLKNQNIIQDEAKRTLKGLDKRLATSKARINRGGTDRYLDYNVNKALAENKLTEMTSKKALNDFANLGKEVLAKHPNTPSGILAARREFDNLVRRAKPTVFDTNLEKPFDDVVRAVRNSMNDIIVKAEPKMKIRGALDKSSRLLSAADAIIPKTAKDISKTSTSKIARGAESLARFSILAKTSSMVRK